MKNRTVRIVAANNDVGGDGVRAPKIKRRSTECREPPLDVRCPTKQNGSRERRSKE
jgi:hypothetical protein